jgi:hypothetical protein
MWAATGSVTSKAPTIADIRRGSFSDAGWNEEPQRAKAERSRSDEANTWMQGRTPSGSLQENARPLLNKGRSNSSAGMGVEPFPAVTEVTEDNLSAYPTRTSQTQKGTMAPSYTNLENDEQRSANGDVDLQKKSKKQKKKPAMQRQVCAIQNLKRMPC